MSDINKLPIGHPHNIKIVPDGADAKHIPTYEELEKELETANKLNYVLGKSGDDKIKELEAENQRLNNALTLSNSRLTEAEMELTKLKLKELETQNNE